MENKKISKAKKTNLWGRIFLLGVAVNFHGPQSLGQNGQQQKSLADYLSEVKAQNHAIKTSNAQVVTAKEKLSETDMMFRPTLFSQGQFAYDRKEASNPMQSMHHAQNMTVGAGVGQLTEKGTQWKLSYNINHTHLFEAKPQFVPIPEYYDVGPSLEISHPLWGGVKTAENLSKSIEVQKKQADLLALGEGFKQQVKLTEARIMYWRLVLARETTSIALDNLDRARKLHSWTQKKVRNELADSTDSIQTEALLKVRELELQMTTEEEKSAALAFNQLRGRDDTVVIEVLEKITSTTLASEIPKKGTRLDVKLARDSIHLSSLGSELNLSKYDPSLDVFGAAIMNGHDKELTEATGEVFELSHPTYVLGLKFSMPLTGSILSSVKNAYTKERIAYQLAAEQKAFEVDREWQDLETKLKEAMRRLALAKEIEEVQNKKLSAEKQKQKTGRSVLFQVISYESDYAGSKLNVLQAQAQILQIKARMHLFAETSVYPSETAPN